MSYETVERESVCVGGVDLVNRHQLSNYQDRELQRFIDANSHLLQWVDEEKITNRNLRKENSPSNYANKSRAMSSEPGLRDHYNSTKNLAKQFKSGREAENESSPLKCLKPPSIDHANYTSEFPGIENITDNNSLSHFINKMKSNESLNKSNSHLYSEQRDRYNSTKNLAKQLKSCREAEIESSPLKCPKPPSIDHANYTSEFPGIENITDNNYLSDFLDKMKSNESLNKNSRANSIISNTTSNYYPTYSESGYGKIGYSSKSDGSENINPAERSCSVPHNSNKERPTSAAGTQSEYGYIDRNKNYYNSPGSTLKRKGVSWLDQERARSLSPDAYQLNTPAMSQYGSIGNLNFRDNAGSPAYSSLGKHKDDYNRFETRGHARAHARANSPFEESRFGGFGDRPGSGVELTSHQWNGGEIITDPTAVPKGLKPRRIYYSPIGDGTVAADGYELKRRPLDLSPKVTITQLQHMDRGEKGHGGVNVYEKSWSNSMGGPDGRNSAIGSEYGPGSGRSSRVGALSPADKSDFPSNYGKPGAGSDGNNHHPNGSRGFSEFPDLNDVLGINGPKNNNFGRSPNGNSDIPRNNFGGDEYPRDGSADNAKSPRCLSSSPYSTSNNYKLVVKTGYLISNPRELIHQYATTTPAAVMDVQDNIPSRTTVKSVSVDKRLQSTQW